MGYERKRGKLAELNSYLRGEASRECFSLIVGKTEALSKVKYIITLDTDTQLPRDAARHLAGATLAHPSMHPSMPHRPHPRRLRHPPATRARKAPQRGRNPWYVRLFADEPGIDPYTHVVSDVYQDLFHEGSFIGKGIYDVEAFAEALSNRFPENRILSHDLIE